MGAQGTTDAGSRRKRIRESLGSVLLAGAVLLSVGCGGRSALLDGVRGAAGASGSGGTTGESSWTRATGTGGSSHAGASSWSKVGVGGSAVGTGGSRDAGWDRSVDGSVDAPLDGSVPVRGDTGGEAKAPDAEIAVDSRGRLRLLAGGLGGCGNSDGIGVAARFFDPTAIASDGAGHLFILDYDSHVIRKVVIATGEVTTLAGSPDFWESTDGIGTAARFSSPHGLTSDGAGNLFVADNNAIRKVVIATGEVTTLAGSSREWGSTDGTGSAARFYAPTGIASDGAGNLFVADYFNYKIRRVVIATGEVTTLASWPGAPFTYPTTVASDGAGNLFVTDSGTIRRVVIATGEVTMLAGSSQQSGSSDGTGTAARFSSPGGIAYGEPGNLFVADTHNSTIRKVAIATGQVTTLAGSSQQTGSSDATGAAARFDDPTGITSDGAGNLFVADRHNCTIRKVVIATGQVTTLAGSPAQQASADGAGSAARFGVPSGIALDGVASLFVADPFNSTIRQVVIATGEVTTLAGSPGQQGSSDGTGAAARFSLPRGIASDGAGHLFVADTYNQTIRRVLIATAAVTTVAGSPGQRGSSDGTGAAARFNSPHGIATDGGGNLFVTDAQNHTIRKVVAATGEVTTLAGSPVRQGDTDGIGAAASFYFPLGIVSDGNDSLFVADGGNNKIRKVVIASGEVMTIAGSGERGSSDGTGAVASFYFPDGIASDGAGTLVVADSGNHTIRKIALGTRTVSTVVGSPDRIGVVLGPLPAGLNAPFGLALASAGEIYVSDSRENAILVAEF